MLTPPNLGLVGRREGFAVDGDVAFTSLGNLDALGAAHGIIVVVVGQFGRARIHHADTNLVSVASVFVSVGRDGHKGFPFTVGKDHGTDAVGLARCRRRCGAFLDVSANHPSVVQCRSGLKDVHPVNAVHRDPTTIGIASVVAASRRIGGATFVEEHHPDVLGRVDGDGLGKGELDEVFSTCEGHVHLSYLVGGSRGAVVVDSHIARHGHVIVGRNFGYGVAVVATSGEHDSPIELSAARTDAVHVDSVVVVVPFTIAVGKVLGSTDGTRQRGHILARRHRNHAVTVGDGQVNHVARA